jgi:hypothetical protein
MSHRLESFSDLLIAFYYISFNKARQLKIACITRKGDVETRPQVILISI